MPRGREALDKLVGKTVSGVSHTDREEAIRTQDLKIYLLFDDGSVFTAGVDGFRVYAPGEYQSESP